MRWGISLTDALLGGCPMVILQIPAWLLTPAVWVSLFPLPSLCSLFPSYQAIPEPQISPVPPSSPRALLTSQKHFTSLSNLISGSPKSSPNFWQAPLSLIHQVLPYFTLFWWNSPTLSKICPRSLHQFWYSPPVTTPRPIFMSQLPFQLSLKHVCWTALLQLPFLHLLLCPYIVDGFLISQTHSHFSVSCSYLLPPLIASCQPSCSSPGFPRAAKLPVDSKKPTINIYHSID